jgi:hypothetical protein
MPRKKRTKGRREAIAACFADKNGSPVLLEEYRFKAVIEHEGESAHDEQTT